MADIPSLHQDDDHGNQALPKPVSAIYDEINEYKVIANPDNMYEIAHINSNLDILKLMISRGASIQQVIDRIKNFETNMDSWLLDEMPTSVKSIIEQHRSQLRLWKNKLIRSSHATPIRADASHLWSSINRLANIIDALCI